jgi:hypothetical protein
MCARVAAATAQRGLEDHHPGRAAADLRCLSPVGGIALIVAVTVEIAINPLGLGAGIMLAQQALRPTSLLAYLSGSASSATR